MTTATPIPDRDARAQALDPRRSFIVQAPAGSGKTDLLTQRFLKLLSGAENPEEIVAITFTRKAAAEMRQRIIEALAGAGSGGEPAGEHERLTRELALAVLSRDTDQGWQLLDNPNRLRLQTIDSLCARLARQMPILSRFGSLPAVADDATPLYLDGARNTLADLDSSAPWSEGIAHLVRHLDNRVDRLQQLIATMLARRDQWLHYLAAPDSAHLDRERLEAAMRNLTTDQLTRVTGLCPPALATEITELARFAARHLPADSRSPVGACRDLGALPGTRPEDLDGWQGLAELLLTREGAWRRSVDVRLGFPAPGSAGGLEARVLFGEMKERALALLESLTRNETLRAELHLLRALPPAHYSDAEWRTLSALIGTLRVAAANLELIFGERGQVDFPALVEAASRALGGAEAPTDLALALDYRIRHILVDEFQDTSLSQFELLRKLTAGWQPDDGHTLFLVGDPMQSIYRFREADVGLFLTAKESGVGDLPLAFLQLSVNFRSQAGIVEWINSRFALVMPQTENIATGAIAFAPSAIRNEALAGDAVTIHPFIDRADAAEADRIDAIVRAARAEDPRASIALLVRSRVHLAHTIALLKREGVPFQAVEIERLANRPVVQDLLSLTRALCHLGDRIAWLAILRAPWCGLDLEDLYHIAGQDHERTIVDLLHDRERMAALGDEGRARVGRALPGLDRALADLGRLSLRATVEGLWYALGGPACVAGATDLADAEVYLQLLERLGERGETLSLAELGDEVSQLFALPDVGADGSLQLMTIHRAKGLEFDVVIIPGLGRPPRGDDERLLYWLERGRTGGGRDLLLAPISARGEERNPIAIYLRELDRTRDRHEASRLMYVAATRAKKRLHLLGHAGVSTRRGQRALRLPPDDSLLARLWPAVGAEFEAAFDAQETRPAMPSPAPSHYRRTRLTLDWTLPEPPDSLRPLAPTPVATTPAAIAFDWAGETARHIGTVTHRLMQQIAETGIETVDADLIERLGRFAPAMLTRLGVPGDRLDEAKASVREALEAAVADPRGRWLLSNVHEEAESELALTGVVGGAIERMVIDRTFVDDEGVRWIIDFKTGSHGGGAIDEFLDRERERYRPQLERYAALLASGHTGAIRLGLYFPLLAGWREWPYEPAPK